MRAIGILIWDLPSSMRTAGPQPGIFRTQCVPLDLNLQFSEFNIYCWTLTWGLPSSVRTSGPQKSDRMPEKMLYKISENISDKISEDIPKDMP